MQTILFVNFRFGTVYSQNLLSRVKEQVNGCRIIAIVDEFFLSNVPHRFREDLDAIYFLRCGTVDHCICPFSYTKLRGLVELELKLCSANKMRIVCTDEINLINVGRIRSEFGIEGLTEDHYKFFRNKIDMKQRLHVKGIRVPRFTRLERESIQPKIVIWQTMRDYIGGDFVVKPINSFGSNRVYFIYNFQDWMRLCDELYDHPYEMQAEELIQGVLYHVDSIRRYKKTIFSAVYEYSCGNFDITLGRNLSSILLTWNDTLYKQLSEFSEQVLDALDAHDQVSHMELFVTSTGEVVFLEVGARPPGGLTCAMAKSDFGFSYVDWDFCIATNIDIQPQLYEQVPAFSIYFPKKCGKVIALNKLPVMSEVDITWLVSEGDELNEFHGISPAAIALLRNPDRQQLIVDFHALKSFEAITLADTTTKCSQ